MMVIAAWFFGVLGGLSAIMGIVTATGVIPQDLPGAGFTAMFWLALGAVLLLICIAVILSRSNYE